MSETLNILFRQTLAWATLRDSKICIKCGRIKTMGEEIKRRRKKVSYSEMDLMLSSIAKDIDERIKNEKEPGEYSKAVFALCQVMAQLGKIKSVSSLEKRLQILEKAYKDGRESTD